MSLLDLIFPKNCVGCQSLGSYLCSNCQPRIEYLEKQFCPKCSSPAIGGLTHPKCQRRGSIDGLTSFTYYSHPVKNLIHQLKYRFTTSLLSEIETKIKLELSLPSKEKFTLIPIPLHKNRQNSRGFNQSSLLGKVVARKLQVAFNDKILIREVATASQVGLSRNERLKNVEKAFKATTNLANERLIIFDDVWTTGSTITNAARELKKAGAKEVWGLTLARSR